MTSQSYPGRTPVVTLRRDALGDKRHVFLGVFVSSLVFTAWLIFSLTPPYLQTVELPTIQRSAHDTAVSRDRRQPTNAIETLSRSSVINLNFLQNVSPIGCDTLTAILPVTRKFLPDLEAVLSPFFHPLATLREVVISCPEEILPEVRNTLQMMFSKTQCDDCPDVSLRSWVNIEGQDIGVLRAASQVTTEWILFLDEGGLTQVDSRTRDSLLSPHAVPFPIGPRGVLSSPVTGTLSCVVPLDFPQIVSYLLPPFVTPSSLVPSDNTELFRHDIWAYLGRRSSDSQPGGLGGIVIEQSESAGCSAEAILQGQHLHSAGRWQPNDDASHMDSDYGFVRSNDTQVPGVFALLLPSSRDLRFLAAAACKLQNVGHKISVLLFREISGSEVRSDIPLNSESQFITSGRCRLYYDVISMANMQRADGIARHWLGSLAIWPDVVLTVTEKDALPDDVGLHLEERDVLNVTLIRIPRADLPYTSWMGSLSTEEWRNWNVPHVDVSIITKNRPRSLARLMSSLASARYFGDALNLRVNLEQSSDAETLRMAEGFEWDHGSVYLHHRVVHGGLLPAVVESWYPHSNHNYGLLLEDDVELSPLFYAWVKMSILRYRYGRKSNQSPQLFGISLYQQKNIELSPEGRRSFNARVLFSDSGLPQPLTPYLSQIPCSWGAVYFPEHWREFHSYLPLRLSRDFPRIDQHIVLGVRSNRWSKSWKKYFIELVYLRGYVMLYPNYENFTSLSTNHLEAGSHVKNPSKEKMELFLLPLMKLPNVHSLPSSGGLLDLPGESLPSWHALPILNLTGSLTSLDNLINQGALRRSTLTGCLNESSVPYDIRDLMCIEDESL